LHSGLPLNPGVTHSKEKVKEKKKKKVRCYDCGKLGHVRRDCPERYQKASANVAMSKSDLDNDGDVLSVSDNVQSIEAWMLDSVSSFLATHKREWLTTYKSGDFGLAYLGDDMGENPSPVYTDVRAWRLQDDEYLPRWSLLELCRILCTGWLRLDLELY
jgi:hypothetical protein